MVRRLGRTFIALVMLVVSTAWVQSSERQSDSGTRRIPQFSNDEVRVWKSVILPGQPLELHRHNHGRVVVALAGGEVKFVSRSGQARTTRFEAGKAYWLPADPPGEYHTDHAQGKPPIELMVIELDKSH